jgi:hypothetical protein
MDAKLKLGDPPSGLGGYLRGDVDQRQLQNAIRLLVQRRALPAE